MPKRSIIILSVLMLLCSIFLQTPALHAMEQDERQTIDTLFQYMKEGNNNGILSMLADPLLSRKRALLRKKSYSIFLKKTYGSADLSIVRVEYAGTDRSSIDVDIDFKDGGIPLKTRFILEKNGGIWKISDELTDF